MKQKMTNSKVGKFLRRIVGEEAGAVMMEYVIVAVLVAAAAVVAIAYFGRQVVNEASVATTAMSGNGNAAATDQKTAQGLADTYGKDAIKNNKDFSDATGEGIKK